MTELLFIVTEEAGGGYVAQAVGESICAQARSDGELERNVREAVRTHFDRPEHMPQVLHLHFVRDRTIPLLAVTDAPGVPDRFSLRGSVIAYDDPFAPACPPKDWEANR